MKNSTGKYDTSTRFLKYYICKITSLEHICCLSAINGISLKKDKYFALINRKMLTY